MDGLSFLAIWLTCGLIGAIIGTRKSEGCLMFIFALILGPLGIVPAILSKGNLPQCPHCKRYIRKRATVCPYCHKRVRPKEHPPWQASGGTPAAS